MFRALKVSVEKHFQVLEDDFVNKQLVVWIKLSTNTPFMLK